MTFLVVCWTSLLYLKNLDNLAKAGFEFLARAGGRLDESPLKQVQKDVDCFRLKI